MLDRRKLINDKLSLVPELPGIYQMKNKDDFIIYVGKSKNLKKRLKSYFTKTVTGKTLMLVNDIYNFEYVVTKNELEALILELNLIKKYVPKYNILLKDDKSYPYIELTDEEYPILKVVRNIKRNKKKTTYFGPFPNVTAARRTVDILNRMYPLRKCKIMGKDLCLYYHIGECLGYCRKDIVDIKQMDEMRSEIVSFLNGNKTYIVSKIEEQMNKASEELNYEKAIELKQMLDDINITLTKQTIDLNRNYNLDVFGYYQNNNYLSVFILFIRKGIIFGHHKEIVNIVDEKEEEIIEYIIKYYDVVRITYSQHLDCCFTIFRGYLIAIKILNVCFVSFGSKCCIHFIYKVTIQHLSSIYIYLSNIRVCCINKCYPMNSLCLNSTTNQNRTY